KGGAGRGRVLLFHARCELVWAGDDAELGHTGVSWSAVVRPTASRVLHRGLVVSILRQPVLCTVAFVCGPNEREGTTRWRWSGNIGLYAGWWWPHAQQPLHRVSSRLFWS